MSLLDGIGGLAKGGAELAGGVASLEAGNIGGLGALTQGMKDMTSSLMGMGATQDQAKDIMSNVLSSALGGSQQPGQQGVEGQHHHHHHYDNQQQQQQQSGLSPELQQEVTQMLQAYMQQQMQGQ